MLSKLRAILAFLHSAIYVIALVVGVVLLALFFFSKTPEKTDERLVSAFVEMRVAEQLYGGDSPMGRLVRREVLKKYGYTREEFLKATDKVLDKGEGWMPFQMAVSERIDSLLGMPKVIPIQKKDKK
ncbi:hypothetical protein FSU_2063 [Fibrobacter succinogenes subsp. succinogenes S85]|uniref:Uncharacterized protein n=1 Tax=Fibrobacter succinogenes (strain ATCC 19169 / S85) TaxID=59374 RepID=C9RRI5_FIBSS|nr:hypothetical protein [Fibrobacter succinogenes]ACX75171.1 hypothetical protein Fisuc_1576 [Fibrobacter succinogenes subsp. succinogenes S85]ADL26774.1 hypothetical protein FSU_2063 [Fibrobacter succinogenes subsp. succinogenes S85]